MRLEESLLHYISNVPKFEGLGATYTGKDVYEHFRTQAEYREIDIFTKPRFSKKFQYYLDSQSRIDFLEARAAEITRLTQKLFEKRFSA